MRKFFGTLCLAATLLTWVGCSCNQQENATSDNTADIVMNNILTRKSVRSFTTDTIAADVMQQLLKAAMAAPSGMNIQPWQVVILTDRSHIDALLGGEGHNGNIFRQAAAAVVLCADTTVTRAPRDNPDGEKVTMPNPLWRDDMGACTENLLLAVEAYGLGALWTACYPFADRMAPVREDLGLPSEVVPYCVVAIGHPAGDTQPKDKWDAGKVHTERW